MKNRNGISHYVSIGQSPPIEKQTQNVGTIKYKPIIKRINIDLDTEIEDIDSDDSNQDIDPPGYESAPERYYSAKSVSLFGLKTSSRELLHFIG